MKFYLLIVLIIGSVSALAEATFQLEDSSSASKLKDLYVISCTEKCKILIRSTKNADIISKSSSWLGLIRELIAVDKPKLVNSKITGRKLLYRVIVNDGDKKINFVIGYPNIYTADEIQLYKNLVSKVEHLKNAMKSEVLKSATVRP